MIDLLQTSPGTFAGAMMVLGLLVGSFLNVVIHRLPIMMQRGWRADCRSIFPDELSADPADEQAYNIVTPRSACPACGHQITALENIPLVSYLWLRGKCSGCGAAISPRYPAIELLSALMSAFVAWHFGFGPEAAMALVLTWSLIALTMIDFDHQLLPDSITLPLLWLGLAMSLFHEVVETTTLFVDPRTSIIGAIAGYGLLRGVYELFKLVTGKEGMGFGDFKLMAALGAWLGWQMLPLIIILSAVVGALTGIFLMVFRRHGREVPIAYGPYIAAAGWVALIWGADLVRAYLQAIGF